MSEELALVWRNLSVFEPRQHFWAREEANRILKGISGVVYSNSLTAIMGPSGAGKSTLLKSLFGTSSVKSRGDFYVGDKSTKAVFITQNEEDHLLLNLTVDEAITFAANINNNSGCRFEQNCPNSEIVQELIDQLDLERCRHTLVAKCSGGQRKRVAIAQELASKIKPKIIFMDEPTSGIDSSVSFMVLEQLQALAKRSGIAIVATIYQPSFKILELFDALYILSRRGRAIYYGSPNELRQHLLGYTLTCPEGHNPADVIIDLASTDIRKQTKRDSRFFALFNSGKVIVHLKTEIDETIETEIQKIETLERVADIQLEDIAEAAGTCTMAKVNSLCDHNVPRNMFHVWFLFRRSLIHSILREPKWLTIRLGLHVLVAAVLALLYNESIGSADGCILINAPNDPSNCSCSAINPESLREDKSYSKNVSFMFFNLLFLMFAALMPTVLTFPGEIKVFLNEHRNGWYNTRSYFWAKTIVELLVQVPLPFFYSLFMYWWTNQVDLESVAQAVPFMKSSRFKTFAWITLLSTLIAQGVGLLIGALFTDNFNISIFVSTIFMLFNFLFSGFFIRISQMGSAQILTRFSFTRFAFEAILLTIYGDNRCPEYRTIVVGNSTYRTPEISSVLYTFDTKDEAFNSNIVWLIVHLIGWRMLTYLTIWRKANPNGFIVKVCLLSLWSQLQLLGSIGRQILFPRIESLEENHLI